MAPLSTLWKALKGSTHGVIPCNCMDLRPVNDYFYALTISNSMGMQPPFF